MKGQNKMIKKTASSPKKKTPTLETRMMMVETLIKTVHEDLIAQGALYRTELYEVNKKVRDVNDKVCNTVNLIDRVIETGIHLEKISTDLDQEIQLINLHNEVQADIIKKHQAKLIGHQRRGDNHAARLRSLERPWFRFKLPTTRPRFKSPTDWLLLHRETFIIITIIAIIIVLIGDIVIRLLGVL
jgi:hypothetical protein